MPLFLFTLLYLEDETPSLKVNYRDAGTAKLYMLIGIMGHIRDAAQVLTDELSEDTIALSMKDSDSWHSYQDGIINEILYGIQCLIATHTSYIQILVEVGLVGIYRLAGLLADTIRSQVFLAFLGLIYVFGWWLWRAPVC